MNAPVQRPYEPSCDSSHPSAFAPGRAECDLSRDDPLHLILAENPALVINAAALTDVDPAEAEPDLAFRLNRNAPERMATACAELSIPLIHFSTDYVFGGVARETPFKEDDTPAPVNIYGESKRAGEEAVLETCDSAFVIRTAWVYSQGGQSFLSRLLAPHLLEGPLHVDQEQISSPTWAGAMGDAVMQLSELLISSPEKAQTSAGVYHLSGTGAASRYEFARQVHVWLGAHQPHLSLPALCPAKSRTFDAAAQRPRYTALECRKADEVLGLTIGGWQEQLQNCLEALYR